MSTWKCFSSASLFWILCLTCLAQTTPGPEQAGQEQKAAPSIPDPKPRPPADHRIWLDVVVTDKAGKPIPGLREQDFTLLDDKLPGKIQSFAASEETGQANPPIQVIFVLDAVNTVTQRIAFERIELDKFLRIGGGQLPVPMSLVLLTDTSTKIQPTPTRDGNVLAASLDDNNTGLRSIGRSAGFWGATERAEMSVRTLSQLAQYEATQPARKLVIWFSSGWPLLSGPGIDLSNKAQDAIFRDVVSFSDTLRQSRITLYAVDPLGMADAGSFRSFYYESFLKGVTSARKVTYGNLALQVLATQSGGRVLNSNNNISSEIADCVRDYKAFYTISFEAPPADHPDEYHTLEVKVDKPGLTARTRTGYYAQPYKNDAR
jgi:VWFA-related protein